MHPDPLGNWIAWGSLVVGSVYVVGGLRAKGSPGTRYFGPFGLWWILSGAFRFLSGRLPEMPLHALFVVSFLPVGVWFVRTLRASKADRSANDHSDRRAHG